MSTPQILNQETELVDIATLVRHPDNVNEGDTETIRASIAEHGFYGTVLVQRSTRRVLYGWHRTQEFAHLGGTQVPVTWVDVDDARAIRIVLVDNESNRRGRNDESRLLDVLERLEAEDQGLVGSGFDNDDLADLRARLEMAESDEVPPDRLKDKSFKVNSDGQRNVQDRRIIVFDLPVDRFAWLVEQLQVVCVAEGVETNSAAVLLLVANYTGTEIPRASEDLDDPDA